MVFLESWAFGIWIKRKVVMRTFYKSYFKGNRRFNWNSSKTSITFLTSFLCVCSVISFYFGTVAFAQNPSSEARANEETTDKKGEPPTEPRKRAEYFDCAIDYSYLQEDQLPILTVGMRELFELIKKDEYEQAKKKAGELIQNLIEKNTPWNADIKYEAWMESNVGFGLNQYIHIMAVAQELNGEYDKALMSYGAVYMTNLEAFDWTYARLLYGKGRKPFAFNRVYMTLTEYHNLSLESIERVKQKVKETEEAFYNKDKRLDLFRTGIPVGRDELGRLDLEALELYRIRDWCAQIVCPKLHFTYPSVWNEERRDRPQYVELTRKSYAEFLKFMEEEFEKYSPKGELKPTKQSPGRAEQSMEFLRKLSELPY